jgi:hypothetical protein
MLYAAAKVETHLSAFAILSIYTNLPLPILRLTHHILHQLMTCSKLALPPETLAQIATDLDLVSLIHFSQTCRTWKQVCIDLQPVRDVVKRTLREWPTDTEQTAALAHLARRGTFAGESTFRYLLTYAGRSFLINWLELPLLPERIWREAFEARFVADVVHNARQDTSIPWRAKYWK